LPSFVSVGKAPVNMLQVYPNPTNGLFVISSPSAEMMEMKATIINEKGKTILTKQCKGANSYSFDISQAAAGNYFVKVETRVKTYVLKVVVQ
jgi:hypothetical protein